MSTLREAEAARDAHAESLRQEGAHAIEVARVTRRGKKTYAVIAHFEARPEQELPETLEVTIGERRTRVPLAIRISPPFVPE